MAQQLTVGTEVYVPVARIGNFEWPSALYRTKVQAVVDRSIEIDVRGKLHRIAASAVHTSIGVLVVRFGDLLTEATLLDPMAKSLLHFGRLLLTDDSVRLLQVRSLNELDQYWKLNHAGFAHVVMIGHGSPRSVTFAVDGPVEAAKLTNIFGSPSGVTAKTFVSLACQTGQAGFGKQFSEAACCSSFLAPYHSVHGAVASQFCQTLLAYAMLQGESIGVAYRHARESVPGSVSFRLWAGGVLKT
jgi:hypothetical protein